MREGHAVERPLVGRGICQEGGHVTSDRSGLEQLKAARSNAVDRLMIDLRLRSSNLAQLDVTDVDLKARTLWIRRRFRRKWCAQKEGLALPDPTLAALGAWLEVRGAVAAENETALFVGLSGRLSGPPYRRR
jgi:site-specific recombinase XerC